MSQTDASNLTSAKEEILITGVGYVAHSNLSDALAGRTPDEATPEITGFEVPEVAPAFGFELTDFEIEKYLPHIKTYVDRTSALALAAAREALNDAGIPGSSQGTGPLDVGCAYGTTMGCLQSMEIFWQKVKTSKPKFAPPLPFTHSFTNSPSSLLCIEFGLKGSAATFSGDQTVGLQALQFAILQLETKASETMLVCASESLTRAMHAHLHAAGRLSVTGRLDPSTSGSRGVVPGEGAACLVLETGSAARARNAKILAKLSYVGVSGDIGATALTSAWQTAGKQCSSFGVEVMGHPALIAGSPSDPLLDDTENLFWKEFLKAHNPSLVARPKQFCGELLSASPLLGMALAARALSTGQFPKGLFVPTRHGPEASSPAQAWIGSSDPGGLAGIAVLECR